MSVTSKDKCRRRTCTRKRKGSNDQRPFCSAQCFWAHKHIQEADALVAYLGLSAPIDNYLMSAVQLSQALDNVLTNRANLRRLASEAGIDNAQWDLLIRGVPATGQSVEDTAAVVG